MRIPSFPLYVHLSFTFMHSHGRCVCVRRHVCRLACFKREIMMSIEWVKCVYTHMPSSLCFSFAYRHTPWVFPYIHTSAGYLLWMCLCEHSSNVGVHVCVYVWICVHICLRMIFTDPLQLCIHTYWCISHAKNDTLIKIAYVCLYVYTCTETGDILHRLTYACTYMRVYIFVST